ncbi:MAG: helix-turn-helix transcriptional regulator, partial [Ruminococcaceae bacterium]|nr:helix-turn-helix transcriptional regulator [Oscillospiraceae bacterium]
VRIRLNAVIGKEEGSKAIQDICSYINDHFAEPLTLDDIAKQFFISRAKLVRIFRGTLDISVGDYLTNVRISKAKSMLHQGETVHEAAIRCGYANVGYFIRIFREHTGFTPADYKRIY